MNILIYFILFLLGIFFGSFFTLAIHRIPRNEDILIKRSYCPNCNHRLGFFDLFPVFSYILLGGKCRYCGERIKPKYLIIEICTGITFVLMGFAFKISNVENITYILFAILYIAILFIVAGIDKENLMVDKRVITVGYIFELIYIIYQCTLGNINVYQYIIYLILFLIVLIISIISLYKKLKEEYFIQNLYLILYMVIFSGSKIFILTAILTLMIIAIHTILIKSKNRAKDIPIGYYMSISNVIIIIILNIIKNYILI